MNLSDAFRRIDADFENYMEAGDCTPFPADVFGALRADPQASAEAFAGWLSAEGENAGSPSALTLAPYLARFIAHGSCVPPLLEALRGLPRDLACAREFTREIEPALYFCGKETSAPMRDFLTDFAAPPRWTPLVFAAYTRLHLDGAVSRPSWLSALRTALLVQKVMRRTRGKHRPSAELMLAESVNTIVIIALNAAPRELEEEIGDFCRREGAIAGKLDATVKTMLAPESASDPTGFRTPPPLRAFVAPEKLPYWESEYHVVRAKLVEVEDAREDGDAAAVGRLCGEIFARRAELVDIVMETLTAFADNLYAAADSDALDFVGAIPAFAGELAEAEFISPLVDLIALDADEQNEFLERDDTDTLFTALCACAVKHPEAFLRHLADESGATRRAAVLNHASLILAAHGKFSRETALANTERFFATENAEPGVLSCLPASLSGLVALEMDSSRFRPLLINLAGKRLLDTDILNETEIDATVEGPASLRTLMADFPVEMAALDYLFLRTSAE